MRSRMTVPPIDVPDSVRSRLHALGAPDAMASLPVYRALAHHEGALTGWIELQQHLRSSAITPRRLRELVICRVSMLADCDYELIPHQDVARHSGVTEDELDHLADWRNSPTLSPAERAALALAEGMFANDVPDDVLAELDQHFSPAEKIELILTTGWYCAAPRIVGALRLPLEPEYLELVAAIARPATT